MRVGEKIGESKTNNTAVRLLPDSGRGPEIEVGFEEVGTLLGKDVTGVGTYVCQVRADGTYYGEGHGVFFGPKGEQVSWTGCGVGRPTGKKGAAKWKVALFYSTSAAAFERLNDTCGLVEYEADEAGKGKSETFEWRVER